MSGHFEVMDEPAGGYRFRMLDAKGKEVGSSVIFPTKRAAIAGLTKMREIAGTGLIRDLSRTAGMPGASPRSR